MLRSRPERKSMSTWKELDPLGQDIGDALRSLAQVLTDIVALRSDDHAVYLFVPMESVLGRGAEMSVTVEDGEGPGQADILVFPEEAVDATIAGESLAGVPDPPLPKGSSMWLCEQTEAPARIVLETRGATFALHPIRPPQRPRFPSPAKEKRGEASGNLKRRSDWFRGGPRRQ